MQDLNALKGKPIAQLREIAKALGIGNVMVKKRELIELIAGHAQGAAPSGDGAPAAQPGAEKPRRGRRPRVVQPEKTRRRRRAGFSTNRPRNRHPLRALRAPKFRNRPFSRHPSAGAASPRTRIRSRNLSTGRMLISNRTMTLRKTISRVKSRVKGFLK